MHIVIAGGSGFLGSRLRRRLEAEGHRVTVLSRRPRAAYEAEWNPARLDPSWTRIIDGADAVVNLAGASIAGGRWTPARQQVLRDSRIVPTRALVEAILAAEKPPGVLVSGSAVGIYGPHGDERVTEDTPPGSDFLAQVGVAWEAEARRAEAATRVVLLRTGIVLDAREGALPQMALPFKLMAGGPVGSGRQFMPWIHVDDWVDMAWWAIFTDTVRGPLNATAPEPVTNTTFAKALGRALRRPAVIPAPGFALKLLLGEMAEPLLLTGQRAVPAKAQALGFRFAYVDVESALRAIYSKD